MTYQNIFILGARGNIGSTVIKQIFEKDDNNPKKHTNPTRIVGLASISDYIFKKDGFTEEQCKEFIKKRDTENQISMKEIIEKGSECNNLIFIDVTASKALLNFHKEAISKDFGIVTANKNPLAFCDTKTFNELTSQPQKYGYRCSVMAGAESITFLQDLRDVNDKLISLSGCFSGTLGYICSELDKEKTFSEIVKTAKDKGYTEPHPKDDLNGLDVARKLLILARSAGLDISIDDIKINPFIPQEYLEENDINKFLNSMNNLDEEFNNKIINAKEKNQVLRYVAEYDGNQFTVGLKEVEKNSPLGSLSGTLNKIVIITENYPKDNPYSVEAPGAGLEVTAQNVRRDLLHQIKERKF